MRQPKKALALVFNCFEFRMVNLFFCLEKNCCFVHLLAEPVFKYIFPAASQLKKSLPTTETTLNILQSETMVNTLVLIGFLFRNNAVRLRPVQAFFPLHFSIARQTFRRSAFFSANDDGDQSEISFQAIQGKRVLVVGGSGRVGGSVVTQLVKRGAKVTVGATSEERYQKSKTRWQTIFDLPDMAASVAFAPVHRERAETIVRELENRSYDLVVHTAGPFQGKATAVNGVLDACVSSKVPYIDVCDDYCTGTAAKTKFSQKAQDAGVPCIISTGCWVSHTRKVGDALLSTISP
jgi:hypothetical protein